MSFGDERYERTCSEPVLRGALAGTLDLIPEVERELRNLKRELRDIAQSDIGQLIPRLLASEQLPKLLLRVLTITAAFANDPDVSEGLRELGLSTPQMYVRWARTAALPLLLDSCDPPTKAKRKSMRKPAARIAAQTIRQPPGLAQCTPEVIGKPEI